MIVGRNPYLVISHSFNIVELVKFERNRTSDIATWLKMLLSTMTAKKYWLEGSRKIFAIKEQNCR